MQKRIYFINKLYIFILSFFILFASNYGCDDKKFEELKVDILLDRKYIDIFQGEEVYFSCKAVGGLSPYTYSWNFGVGIPSSSVKTPGLIAFQFESTKKIILTVKDSTGITSEDYVYINVKKRFDIGP